jgi:hypothetical protein
MDKVQKKQVVQKGSEVSFLILSKKCTNCHRFIILYLKTFHCYMFRTLSIHRQGEHHTSDVLPDEGPKHVAVECY